MNNKTIYISILFILLFALFIILHSSSIPTTVLLSFDVEPVDGNESVIAVLDVLEKTDTKATFFFLGSYAEQYPEVVKMADEQGHEIACHGYSHKPFTKMNDRERLLEITDCKNILTRLTNKTPIGFRAPYNKINKATYNIIKEEFDYDATQIEGFSLFFPNPDMPEVKISSIFLIPAEDVIWLYFLHLPESFYFYLMEHNCCTASYLFHTHHISTPRRLERLEQLIKGLKARNATFIKHREFILLHNDNK